MRDVPLGGQNVPIITQSKAPGDILNQASGTDKNVSGAEREFLDKNMGIAGSMGQSPQDQMEDSGIRKSTLIEIPTPTSRLLYKINALWPFDLFPDSLVIDEIKISIIYRGFLTRLINNILIKDITDILISNNPFFGALTISGGDYQGNGSTEGQNGPLKINCLRINEALKARRIILGLMIFSDQKVDTSQMPITEVVKKTEELGRAREG